MALALILAAGRGERLGADAPKALAELAGRSLLQWSVDLMLAVESVERVVVALPPGMRDAPAGTVGVEGGRCARSPSRGLLRWQGPAIREIRSWSTTPPGHLPRLSSYERRSRPSPRTTSLDAAIAATPVSDTVKRVSDGVVSETLDRSALWAVQTPQVFRRSALERALDVSPQILARATDDAWLIERLGGRVAVVPADGENLKITTPLDLALAELLIARRPA